MRPNLFDYATSELSQDAALCWLLKWADADAAGADPALHASAREFLALLFRAASAGDPPGGAIHVHKQLHDADVVAEIGASHLLVIEDKVHTGDHSKQLERYRKKLGKKFPDRQLVLVYLKTGDQASYEEVREQGWAVVTRKQLLGVFDAARDVRSDIFSDYRDRLRKLEASVEAFRTTPPGTWDSPAWRGFYMELQSRCPTLGLEWGYVSNPAGGFIGCWWGFWSVRQGVIHLQLAEDQLVVKVKPTKEEWQAVLRDRWVDRLTHEVSTPRFVRPKRLGKGEHMTVGVHDGEYRVTGPDGLIDLDATVKVLERATEKIAALAGA